MRAGAGEGFVNNLALLNLAVHFGQHVVVVGVFKRDETRLHFEFNLKEAMDEQCVRSYHRQYDCMSNQSCVPEHVPNLVVLTALLRVVPPTTPFQHMIWKNKTRKRLMARSTDLDGEPKDKFIVKKMCSFLVLFSSSFLSLL